MKGLILFLLSSVMLACGNDSQNDSGNNITSEITPDNLGILTDFKFSGLRFESGALQGYTDENGQFGYQNGEMIQFYVGDIPIGFEVEPNKTLSVSDLSDNDSSIIINITRFLLSLDDDNNPKNGVNIELSIHQQAVNVSLDFTSQAWKLTEFGNTEIQELLDSITRQTITGARSLVSSSDTYFLLSSLLNVSMDKLEEQIISELNISECETSNQCKFHTIPTSFVGFCAPQPDIHVYSETTTNIDNVQLLSAQRNEILEAKSNLHANADLPILGGLCTISQQPRYPLYNQLNMCEISDEFPFLVIE